MPCANGEYVDGKLCPYIEHQPKTIDGWEAWEVVLRSISQVKLSPTKILGFDHSALFSMCTQLNYDSKQLVYLLLAAEVGFMEVINKRNGEV